MIIVIKLKVIISIKWSISKCILNGLAITLISSSTRNSSLILLDKINSERLFRRINPYFHQRLCNNDGKIGIRGRPSSKSPISDTLSKIGKRIVIVPENLQGFIFIQSAILKMQVVGAFNLSLYFLTNKNNVNNVDRIMIKIGRYVCGSAFNELILTWHLEIAILQYS